MTKNGPSLDTSTKTTKATAYVSTKMTSEKNSPYFSTLSPPVRNILAGGIAGMAAKSVVAPIDRIKILYQISSLHFRIVDVPGVFRNIVRNEGFAALWRGNTATMVRVFPYAGTQFMIFDWWKTVFLEGRKEGRIGRMSNEKNSEWYGNKNQLSAVESLIAGSCAGAVSAIITYPLDITRAQLAVQKRNSGSGAGAMMPSRGFVHALTGNYNKNGVTGLFRGIIPTLCGILPYSGIAFTMNEQTKAQVGRIKERDPSTTEKMLCGAISGLVAQSLTYPLDVIRRRMQTIGIVQTSTGSTLSSPSLVLDVGPGRRAVATNSSAIVMEGEIVAKPLSMLHTVRQVVQEQGIRGFYKGVTLNWFKGPIAFSISFTTFDLMKDLLQG